LHSSLHVNGYQPYPHSFPTRRSSDLIKVPMREIELSPTTGTFGEEENPPLRVYDTSGPYTDENYTVDITKGLPALREKWIRERGDVEAYEPREVKPE